MITLYYRPSCPFCKKVQQTVDELSIPVEWKDIGDARLAAELVARGGKKQVPFMVDEAQGKMLYGSMDIDEYLRALPKA